MTMVGIPARNEAATVAGVATAADAGLMAAFPTSDTMIVLADNGSTDDTTARFLATPTTARKHVVQSGGHATGKGTNVLALVRIALEHDADQLILLDADVRSGQPEWIARLAAALDATQPSLAVPTYRRNRYEANTTNHLAGPLVAALFGTSLQQPIGGEFALNRALLRRIRHWHAPESVSLYGIDIWLTANALRERHQVVEVPLGVKLHNSPFPKILHLPLQVLDALLHVALRLERPRPADMDSPGARRSAVDSRLVPQDPALVARIAATVAGYIATHETELRRVFPAAADLPDAPWGLRITTQDWPHLLADAMEALPHEGLRRVRDHLIALYIGRVLSFWPEIDGMSGAEIDALLDRQAGDTVKAVAERSVTFPGTSAASGFDRGHWTGIR